MISYPTTRLADGVSYLSHQAEGAPPVIGELPITRTSGDVNYDVRQLEELGSEAFETYVRPNPSDGAGNLKGEEFEGDYGPKLYAIVEHLPARILTDRGFWRYLALGPLYEVVRWRHGHANLPGYGCAPTAQVACLPWRLFMRAEIGRIEGEEDPFRLAKVKGTDLWWSHILRIEIGRSKPTAQALLNLVQESEMPVSQIRLLAPRITRLRSTIMFEALADAEIVDAIREERDR